MRILLPRNTLIYKLFIPLAIACVPAGASAQLLMIVPHSGEEEPAVYLPDDVSAAAANRATETAPQARLAKTPKEVPAEEVKPEHQAVPQTGFRPSSYAFNTNAEAVTPVPGPVASEPDVTELQQTDTFVDQLIDPAIGEDTLEDLFIENDPPGLNLYQELDFRTQFVSDPSGDTRTLYGLGYTAVKPTANFGNFRLRLVANQGDDRGVFADGNVDDLNGLRYYQLSQTAFPLTENIYLNNTLGTHTLSFDSRQSRNLVSRRFNAIEPDILGITSQLYAGDTAISLSYGQLGFSRGLLLEGFEDTDGDVARVQFRQAFGQHLVTADYWNTFNFDEQATVNAPSFGLVSGENSGYQLTLDSVYAGNWRSTVTLAGSEGAKAIFAGMEQGENSFRQDFGAYYYEPDFVWINRQIDQDSTGAYYRFSNSNYLFNYGASAEWRRDGVERDNDRSRDTYFVTANLSHQIDLDKQVLFRYRLRDSNGSSGTIGGGSYTDHDINSRLNLQHSLQVRSAFSLGYGHRSSDGVTGDEDEYRVDYDFFYEIDHRNALDFSLGYTRQENDELGDTNLYFARAGWDKSFDSGGLLGVTLGYNLNEQVRGSENQGFNASLHYSRSLTDNLQFNVQANYNRNDLDFDDGLVTSPGLVTDDEQELNTLDSHSDSYSVYISLRYVLNGVRSNPVLGSRGRAGSGSVDGKLYIDNNQDGIRQPSEAGVAGITVYLDGIYPTRTDEQGRFSFPSVGIGEHFLFIDETELPLPLSLNGIERIPVTVRLRGEAQLDIKVYQLEEVNNHYPLEENNVSQLDSRTSAGFGE